VPAALPALLTMRTRARDVLTKLVRLHGWARGAEIGVYRGATLIPLLEACPGLTMLAVDQWRRLPRRDLECSETYEHADMAALEADVRQRAHLFGSRCIIFKAESVFAASMVCDAWLDFVFIDADHTEPAVRADIVAWAPKVRPGGMILGHDNHWPTVRRVINEVFPGWEDLGEAVWAVQT